MRVCLALVLTLLAAHAAAPERVERSGASKKVYVLPIRENIERPILYLVRRGVKEAMAARADLLVIDMDTNGGYVNVTEELIESLNQFKGQTATFVNRKAFSAGAFISVATQKIYMAPQSVIGAAAPIIMVPGGGPEKVPDTWEVKMTSALSALVRTSAEKNGYNKAVVEKMIDKSKELKIDGEVLNEKGQILTLTNLEAEKPYGDPPKPLLSSGTVENLDELLQKLGFANAERHDIKPTGAELLGTWLNAIAPLLLIIGIAGIYIEFKTPGFGLPGVIGLTAFALYFLGGYVAGLSGVEWVAVFLLGLALVIVEMFVFPGTVVVGMIGAALMLASIIMALVDLYPSPAPGPAPGLPGLPNIAVRGLERPLWTLLVATLGSAAAVWLLNRFFPKTPVYRAIVSQSASGVNTEALVEKQKIARQGQVGVTVSTLRPGGKAQFGEQLLDVVSQGDLVPKGTKVRIIGSRGTDALVEVVGEREATA
jgi:membrane-bound serine protease (ClpP class)